MDWLADLLRGLSSDDEAVQSEAAFQIAMLLEQDQRIQAHEADVQTPRRRPSRRAESAEAFAEHLQQSYRGLLPEQRIGMGLRDEERETIAAALLRLVEREVPTTSEIFALGKGWYQHAIPQITAALLRCIGVDAWVVHQAAYTLADLLYPPRHGRLSKRQRAIFHAACRAIGSVVTPTLTYPPYPPERGGVPDPRQTAVQVLGGLCGRFAARPPRGMLPRQRQGDHLTSVGAVQETTTLPTGDLAVFGPLRLGMQHELQAPTVIEHPDDTRIPATYVGQHFELGAWPPRMGLVLRGVAAEAVPIGSRYVVSHAQADARLREEATRSWTPGGLVSLVLESRVVRDGLPADAFVLVHRRVEDLGPLGAPDPELEAWMTRLQGLDT